MHVYWSASCSARPGQATLVNIPQLIFRKVAANAAEISGLDEAAVDQAFETGAAAHRVRHRQLQARRFIEHHLARVLFRQMGSVQGYTRTADRRVRAAA